MMVEVGGLLGGLDDIRIYNRALSQPELDSLVTSGSRVADSSGNGNHGAAAQDTQIISTTGKINTALSFNGSSDYVSTFNAKDVLSGSFTFSWWQEVNIPGSDASRSFRDAGTAGFATEFDINSLGGIYFYYTSQSANYGLYKENVFLAGNQGWHHFSLTAESGGVLKLYLDGEEVNDVTPIGIWASADMSTYDSVNNLEIGRYGATDGYVQGKIDDFRLYSRALTEQEVKSLYFFGDGTEEEGAGEI